ncbi:MAG: phytanoyl-CoA dioxygenase family protein [Verrucomicrobiae bacterium]|nr:phytanoyl-CoA dioxygenase family protein [Verrucomicrobiae bacterium]MDW8343368.1 phytanoyl-CoA dioxygenase family protein [Verrucomicrobiae bacterium]
MNITPTLHSVVSEEQLEQYETEGYMILERVIPDDMLQMLREECAYFLGYNDALMDSRGIRTEGLNHRGKRYFISNRYRLSPRMRDFIFSPLMAEITQAVLGPNVYLFHEQWVVKAAEQGMKFAWHQDSGYVKAGDPQTRHRPYLTCWCTLDDVNEENGTVYILPHSRGGTKNTIYTHTQEQGTNDLIGYTGDDPGIPVIVPAGSIVAFSSYTLHRSGANRTKRMRRIYLPQYSAEPIITSKGERWGMAVPFILNGKVVYDPATDTAERYGGYPGIPA